MKGARRGGTQHAPKVDGSAESGASGICGFLMVCAGIPHMSVYSSTVKSAPHRENTIKRSIARGYADKRHTHKKIGPHPRCWDCAHTEGFADFGPVSDCESHQDFTERITHIYLPHGTKMENKNENNSDEMEVPAARRVADPDTSMTHPRRTTNTGCQRHTSTRSQCRRLSPFLNFCCCISSVCRSRQHTHTHA